MRNQINTLFVSSAALLILGCSVSFADTKKPKPKPADDLPKESIEFNYGKAEYIYTQSQRGSGSNVRKPITTTVNPALKGSTLGGSTGPNLKRPDGGGSTIGRHQ
jgi:hypothetical protein